MKTVNKLDWAQKVITELGDITQDNAISNFISAFGRGDSAKAWEAYNNKAREVISLPDGQNYLIIFPDGSGYADWHQGINCFFPDATEALTAEEWKEVGR